VAVPKNRAAAFIRPILRDARGVSAIEFALIAPVLILLYCGMAELSSALMAARKTDHAISTVGDLVAQTPATPALPTPTINPSLMANNFQAAVDIMAPYPSTSGSSSTPILLLRATSLVMQADNSIQAIWSCTPSGQNGLTPMAKNTVVVPKTGATTPGGVTISSLLTNPGDSVIMSEGQYAFTSPVSYFIPNALNFSNTFYLKPRQGASIAYSTTGSGASCNG